MRGWKLALAALVAGLGWAAAPMPAAAQQVVYCASDDGSPRFCPMQTGGNVRILQQVSQAPCRAGSSYRVMRDGVEVRNGCRATFQAAGYQYESGWGTSGSYERVRCESIEGRTKFCPMNTRNGIRLEQELSSTACIRNSNWFKERDGVRVTRGCRAVFGANRDWDEGGGWGGSGGSGSGSGNYQTVRCESSGSRRYCAMNTRYGVRLERQLSSTSCREGRTWGIERDRIWVDQGCRGEFVAAGGSGSTGGGWGGSGGSSGSGSDFVRCESTGSRRSCPMDTRYGVVLERQLSSTSCRQNQSWGFDRNGVWVDRGCRGEFRSTRSGGGSGGSGGGWGGSGGSGSGGYQPYQTIRCQSMGGERQFCAIDRPEAMRLIRELSGSRGCRQGSDWGTQRGGIYVQNGCRGEFGNPN